MKISYQRVTLSLPLRVLLGVAPLAGQRVAVKAHVLWPQLQQRWPIVLLGAGGPREALRHPLGRVLPGRPTPVHLKGKQTA